jgi:class 3 adenylate cyclase/tetratricopeptide (TPR) repeat protein
MKNMAPGFIIDQCRKGNCCGDLSAVTMFADISGFTSITEEMMRHGKEGAEILSAVINSIFTSVINQIHLHSGFVAGFAGDSMTVIFPDDNPTRPLLAALAIQKIFPKRGLQRTKFGEFRLSARICLSQGKVQWGIVGDKKHTAYFFKGEAIDSCTGFIQGCAAGEIVVDNRLYHALPTDRESQKVVVIRADDDQPSTPAPRLSGKIVRRFYPQAVVSSQLVGEFRDVTCVFISFEDNLSFEQLNTFSEMVLERTASFGGFFSGFDFGDKGATIFVFFGAPVSYENNIERALDFTLAVKAATAHKIKAGITCGTVYAGGIGSRRRSTYTVVGDTVNLAARFMQRAGWGKVWVSEPVASRVKTADGLGELGSLTFKGKSEPVPVFELIAPKEMAKEFSFEGKMVGRKKELAQLKKRCQPIFSGRFAGVVYLYGEAGIGKSRLFYEFSESMKPAVGALVLKTDNIMQKSMNPFVYFFKSFFAQSEAISSKENQERFETRWTQLMEKLRANPDRQRSAPIMAELSRTKSLLAALMGIYYPDSLYYLLDPKGRFENTIFAIKEFFKAQFLLKPTLLVVEDLHWIDADSLKVFATLTRNIEDFPGVIFCLSRFNDDGSKPELKLDNEIAREELVLEHLPTEAIAEFVQSRLTFPAEADLLAFIAARTEGNPFYIEQFCLYLQEKNLIELENGEYRLVQQETEIPLGIRAILIARLDRLSQELKKVVQTASVLGKEVDIVILSEMLKGKEIQPLLREGEKQTIWYAISEILYMFKHALLRDAAYEMQLKAILRELHNTAALAIEKLYAEDKTYYSDLAFHYERAEIRDKAKEYVSKAADFAKESYQNDDALSLYRRLLNYCESEEEIEARLKMGEILRMVGRLAEAEELFETGLKMANEIGNNLLVAEAEVQKGRLLVNKGEYPQAHSLFVKAEQVFSETGQKSGLCKALGDMGMVFWYQGDLTNALECFQRHLQLAEELGEKRAIIEALGHMGVFYAAQSDFQNAMVWFQKELDHAEEYGDKNRIASASGNMGIVYAELLDLEKAQECLQRQLDISELMGNRRSIAMVSGNMANLYLYHGNLQKCMELIQRQLKIGEELGDKYIISTALDSLGTLYRKLKDYIQAEACYQRAIAIGKALQLRAYLCKYLYHLADLYYAQEKLEPAESLNAEAQTVAKEVNQTESIFETRVLGAKLLFKKDRERAIAQLLEMVKEYGTEWQQAILHQELFKMTKGEEHRRIALEINRRFYEKTRNVEYKERIEEIEKTP